ncbi:OmpA family protein [Persicitalea sp.]|uniref:OmpA family protein n=1 Tax=Persicitalea sp. TaxID=3100273 RepID=UPI0035946019
MRKISSLLLLLALGLRFGVAIGQVTNSPYVEERYTRSVRIVRVELTDQYTIIYMQHGNPALSQKFRMPLPGLGGWISFDPDSRLYKPGLTSQRFMFIKAEGIPVSPKQMNVSPNELVDFRVFFERLDPGIEVFDLFEGPNPEPGHEYWNFYGIHIKNPIIQKPKPRPATPEPAAKPKPEPKPEVQEPIITKRPPTEKQPEKVAVPDASPSAPALVGMTGTIYDAKTQQPIPANLTYLDQDDTVRVGVPSGKYRLGLNSKEDYSLTVGSKGYLSTSFDVSPADSSGATALEHDFYLQPLAKGASVTLDKIYFATSKYELLPESYGELDELATMLRENPAVRIRIEGHTDNLGDFDKNVELSRQRAEAVRDYLTKKGIATERLETQGYGPTRPVGKGNSETERRKNRRVEFVITEI